MTQVTEETKVSIESQFGLFEEATRAFYAKELPAGKYKGTSGKFGSYGEKGGNSSMLRLRFPAGTINGAHMKFLADALVRHDVQLAHFTTGEALQLHRLGEQTVLDLYKEAFAQGIYSYGAGGDNPRNITASPLYGVEVGEPFDMTPVIRAASNFVVNLILKLHLPRKYKVSFSNGIDNEGHATFKDMGFVARTDGTFDVYAGGGMGVNGSRFGALVGEQVDPKEISLYIEGFARHVYMVHGDYEHRGTARSRFILEKLGEEKFREEVQAAVQKAREEGVPLLTFEEVPTLAKSGKDDAVLANPRIRAQKQDGLYYVEYKPLGGVPKREVFQQLLEIASDMEGAELRLNADETCYIVNLTAEEATKIAALTEGDSAHTVFERSVSCIGATVCQQGVGDSHGAFVRLVEKLKAAGVDTQYLPKCHFSGCPSTCSVHVVAALGFQGSVAVLNGERVPAFKVFVGGNYAYGKENIGAAVGTIAEVKLIDFFLALNGILLDAKQEFEAWYEGHTEDFNNLVANFAI